MTWSMEWIYLAQDKDHWCIVLNMLIKILFPKGGEFFDLLLTISFSLLWAGSPINTSITLYTDILCVSVKCFQ
jgi:hypothetical protein